MRMTNKIMQNNSLYNINNNKILQDKLSTMMSTQKKITRPSDDPVIAIRALRLRTSVSELTQYYKKNAPDAESWLDVTEGALKTTTTVLEKIITQANKGSNKDLGAEDLQIILEQMKSLRDEFYATGNGDYGGRYIFTGYRTDTTLTFTEEVEEQEKGYPSYEITEQKTIADFDSVNYTDIGRLGGLSKNNYTDAGYAGIVENDISNGEIHRLRLAYDNVKGTAPVTTPIDPGDPAAGTTTTYTDGELAISIPDPADPADDTKATRIAPVLTVSAESEPDPYSYVMQNPDAIVYVPETGELLFGDEAYNDLEAQVKAVNGTNTEIRLTYTKDEWKKGDLRPEHYFACTGTTREAGADKEINYNQDYLTSDKKRQTIEYDVGYNQKIQVNTTADEVFGHGLDRDIDDLEKALAELVSISATKSDLDAVLKDLDEGTNEYNEVLHQYEAAEKAYSYIRENVHNMFGSTISKMQGHLDNTNVALTDNGTRSQRLALISNRLMDQETTFETLQSENEDIDIAEVVIKLTSTELTYNSALMATGKIMQTSLMNYI